MSVWASRLTFEPLTRPVPLPFCLESEGGHSVLRTTGLALALSLLLHSLFLALLLLRVHATLVWKPPVAVTLIVEPEAAPSKVAAAPPPPSPPVPMRLMSRRAPPHHLSPLPTPVRTRPSPTPAEQTLAPVTKGTAEVAMSPANAASLGAERRVFAEGEVDSGAHPALRIQPRYPERARLLGRESDVKLNVTVEADGRVSKVELLSSGGEEFDREAEDALKRTRFVAARKGGEPVAAALRFTVRFRLDE